MKGLILADIEVMKMQDNNLKEGGTFKLIPAELVQKEESIKETQVVLMNRNLKFCKNI